MHGANNKQLPAECSQMNSHHDHFWGNCIGVQVQLGQPSQSKTNMVQVQKIYKLQQPLVELCLHSVMEILTLTLLVLMLVTVN